MNEFEVKEKLANQRKDIKTFDDLMLFLKDVKEHYNCGYGEAPRAIAQAALATAWYLADVFGITDFQAGFVMWDFIRDWSFSSNECGLKIVNYDEMLYPQYDYKFDKYISSDTFRSMQRQAKELLKDKSFAHPDVVKHWEIIVNGEIPFGYTIKDD